MILCDDGHQEVCFEGGTCPFCDYMVEAGKIISSHEEKIKELQDEIESMEAES